MRALIFCALILLSSVGHASEQSHSLLLFLANKEFRYEKGSDEQFHDRDPENFQVAYYFKKIHIALEYAKYLEETGNGTSAISRKHEELQFWGNYSFFREADEQADLRLSVGMGAGLLRDEIKTQLGAETRRDQGADYFLSGLSLGATYKVNLTKRFAVAGAIEGRGLFSTEFYPNPLWTLNMRLGIGLNF